jgi:hypothetical protein
VTHTDLANSVDRWPHFGPEAVSAGFGSVHAIPLRLRTIVIGALNLFAAEARPLDEPSAHLAQALADVASIAILQDQAAREAVLRAGQLQYALDSRVAIEQAKGMLAERTKSDMDQAFRILRKYARDSRRHLSAVATDIAAGTVPLDEVISATVLSESDHTNG